LVAGETTQVERILVPLTDGTGTLVVSLGEHPDAAIYLDGDIMTTSGTERRIDVSASEEHVLEVYLPGHFVEEYTVELRNGTEWERAVNFRPVLGSVSLSSTPSGTVFVDGEERGVTSSLLSITGLDPLQVHDLEIRPRSRSYRRYRQNIVFDGGYSLRIAPRLPRVTEQDIDASVPFGFLTASAGGEWYRVFVDGRDSGFVTPLTEDAPLPLSEGEHTIGFSRGGERLEVPITVVNEEVVHAERPTP